MMKAVISHKTLLFFFVSLTNETIPKAKLDKINGMYIIACSISSPIAFH